MAVLDRYITKLVCHNATQESITTLNWIVQTSSGPGILQSDVARVVDATFGPLLKPILYNGATYDGTSCQKIVGPPPLVPSIVAVNTGPGTGGATALPAQSCGITTWQTVNAGRKYRGRTYWPFPATAFDTGDGFPTLIYFGLLSTISVAVVAGITVTDGLQTETMVPYVRSASGGANGNIVAYRVNPRWATQRRRGGYGRPNVPPAF